jgi:serine/threonine-protein kinase
MATVYYGRLLGPVGFSRTVAIKQLHPQFSRDPDFVSMFVDEAHLAARIRHPNVVPVLDVVKSGRELYLVMEYVLGASLAELIVAASREGIPIPHGVVSAVVGGCLRGLHAAHETRDDAGELLGIVHRDVSPANVLVGRDGLARVLDFGIAKAASRAQITRHGELKGKVGYMAPEQLRSGEIDRRADVYSVAVTLWEALTRRRAFAGDSDEVFNLRRREHATLPPPSRHDDALAPFDELVMRGLEKRPEDRYLTAEVFADALEVCAPPASIREVSRFVDEMVGESVDERARLLADLEKIASPSEMRAAIREEVGVSVDDAPSISVSTWTDPSLDILELVDEASDRRHDATTREVPASSHEDEPEPPTRVASAPPPAGTPEPPPAESAPIELAREVPHGTPDWAEVSAPPQRRRAPRPLVYFGVVLAMVAVAAVALNVLGDRVEPESRPPPTRNRVTVKETASTAASPQPPAVEPSPEPTSVSTSAEASTSASVAVPRPAPPPPPPAPADPFDSLGGRH